MLLPTKGIRVKWDCEGTYPKDAKLLGEKYGDYPTIEEMEQSFDDLDALRQITSKPPRSFNASIKDEGPKQLLMVAPL
ncbi:unnamed protein product [Linum trigynum]|uniref:Uncharacterized protein n=1 Tax=Linum trigynum TaxID=586398 RepID=A0AAV2D0E2_9ROSI